MKNYTFHIVETRESTLTIKANDIRDAEAIAHRYHDCLMDDVEVTVKIYGCCDHDDRFCEMG